MFKYVVVDVDDGEGGRDAIALARMLSGEGSATSIRATPKRRGHRLLHTRPRSTSGSASCSRR